MVIINIISTYTPDKDWQQYVEWLQFFLEMNRTMDASKKRVTILSVVGLSTFQLSRSLIAPDNLANKTFVELIGVLKAHYNPEPSEIVERCKLSF